MAHHEVRNCSQLEAPSPEAAQSLLMIVTTKPNENFQNFTEEVLKYNKKAPFKFPDPVLFKTLLFVRVRLLLYLTVSIGLLILISSWPCL